MLDKLKRFVRGDVAWLEVQSNRRKVYTAAVVATPLLVGAGLLSSGTAHDVLTVLGVIAGAGGNAVARKHSKGSTK